MATWNVHMPFIFKQFHLQTPCLYCVQVRFTQKTSKTSAGAKFKERSSKESTQGWIGNRVMCFDYNDFFFFLKYFFQFNSKQNIHQIHLKKKPLIHWSLWTESWKKIGISHFPYFLNFFPYSLFKKKLTLWKCEDWKRDINIRNIHLYTFIYRKEKNILKQQNKTDVNKNMNILKQL